MKSEKYIQDLFQAAREEKAQRSFENTIERLDLKAPSAVVQAWNGIKAQVFKYPFLIIGAVGLGVVAMLVLNFLDKKEQAAALINKKSPLESISVPIIDSIPDKVKMVEAKPQINKKVLVLTKHDSLEMLEEHNTHKVTSAQGKEELQIVPIEKILKARSLDTLETPSEIPTGELSKNKEQRDREEMMQEILLTRPITRDTPEVDTLVVFGIENMKNDKRLGLDSLTPDTLRKYIPGTGTNIDIYKYQLLSSTYSLKKPISKAQLGVFKAMLQQHGLAVDISVAGKLPKPRALFLNFSLPQSRELQLEVIGFDFESFDIGVFYAQEEKLVNFSYRFNSLGFTKYIPLNCKGKKVYYFDPKSGDLYGKEGTTNVDIEN